MRVCLVLNCLFCKWHIKYIKLNANILYENIAIAPQKIKYMFMYVSAVYAGYTSSKKTNLFNVCIFYAVNEGNRSVCV